MKVYLVTGRKLVPKFRNAFAATLSSGGPFCCVESKTREWVVEGQNEHDVKVNWLQAKEHNFKPVRGYELMSIEEIK